MIALRGARLILDDRVVEGGTLIIDGFRIVDTVSVSLSSDESRDLPGCVIAPGFIDVHVHGVEGFDVLDEGWPVAAIAERLPRYGITAFCPTTVACAPGELTAVFRAVSLARGRLPEGARVVSAHLESNFINPEFRGAQPAACLRMPPLAVGHVAAVEVGRTQRASAGASWRRESDAGASDYTGADILRAIEAGGESAGIVTLAPELPGSEDLIRSLCARNIRVSLGHSGAAYEQALTAFDAGARHATHLFNRMSPLHHRDPGLVGAVLERDDVDAEIICDGFHVHPVAARLALRLKSVDRILAITDGTAGSGLAVGSRVRLGGRAITVRDTAAFLDDDTLAGSTLTMDRAFRLLVERLGCSLVDAARMCSTNPARALGLPDQGSLRPGALADFVVLDENLQVVETWVDGRCRWRSVGQA